ncbi:cysteine-rich CWC family protein [Spongiibacter nanhainus]|uniref:Cysteine-rich CWC family protein n=2 Tax=Spongiibacter nanhainus TaxID=2794344 RepID=A0A7T4UQR8_9GAMM|nr:cysteine-rich CWC family protein [Spongiibacter nanhainus]
MRPVKPAKAQTFTPDKDAQSASSTASRCPLCGGDNNCYVAMGRNPSDCWCMTQSISSAAREKAGDGSRCLCPGCGATTAP